MTVHILFIDRSTSSCGSCHKETLPDGKTHDVVSGYAGGAAGCGVEWTHVSTHYAGDPGSEEGCREMRPDLVWMDPREAVADETRRYNANVPPNAWPVTDLDEVPW